VSVRAVRGAIQVEANDRDEILQGTSELVAEVLHRNGIDPDDLISIVFTATPDLTAEFPAYAARQMYLRGATALRTDLPQ
jgi:chorismate mutase